MVKNSDNADGNHSASQAVSFQEMTLHSRQTESKHQRQTVQRQMSKTSDRLLISVKPLKDEENIYADEPAGSHNANRSRSQSREGATTLHSRGVVATFSSEESEEDSPTVTGANVERGPSLSAIVLVDHTQPVNATKDADTSPMDGAEMGTQTHAFQTQTSFPAAGDTGMFSAAELNFFHSGLYN